MAAAASKSIEMHGDAPKSVPDPFQASWQASPCISMDLDAAAAADVAAAAAARCVHTLKMERKKILKSNKHRSKQFH